MHSNPTVILKRDALGRIGYTRGQREALLDEFERSGLKGAAFARMIGIQLSDVCQLDPKTAAPAG